MGRKVGGLRKILNEHSLSIFSIQKNMEHIIHLVRPKMFIFYRGFLWERKG